MQRKVAVAALVVIILLSLAPQAIASKPTKNPTNKVVLILMDNITWSHIIAADDPVLNDLQENGSIGLMNNRSFRAMSRPRNALTAGAGMRAEASVSSLQGYNADEPCCDVTAKDVYKLRTGRDARDNEVLELGIAPVIRDNYNGLQDFIPGQLADVLERAGMKTAVLGNSDTSLDYDSGGLYREAVAIAMNSKGLVAYGDVGKRMLVRDDEYPFGVRADYEELEDKFVEYYGKADFIVIDLGDTARADFYARNALDRQAERLRLQAIHSGARFIKKVMELAGDDATFIITALSPPGSTRHSLRSSLEQMTPVIVHGPGYGAGALVSDSTKREGIVTTVDIAPTVLGALNLEKSLDMPGNAMRSVRADVSAEALSKFNQSAVAVKSTRRTAVLAYIYIQIILYAFAVLALAFRKMLNRQSTRVLETLIFTTMGFPLFSFFATRFERIAHSGVVITLLTIGISLTFAVALVALRRKTLDPIIGIAGLTVGLLCVDAVTGADAFINTIFGYDPIRGSRFFGIGNEAMAILVANTLLLFGILLERVWNRWTVVAGVLLSGAVTIVIGFPGIGANTGGTIAAVFAFSAMTIQAMRSKAKVRNVLIAAAAVVVVLGSFVAYDTLNGATTHMGKAMNLVLTGGLPEVAMIARRKLAMNLMVLRYSTWSYFLLITLGLLALMWVRPVGVLQRSLINRPGMKAAISASLIGGVAGYAFNDSGILVPAIIMSYMIPTVIYLMLREQYNATG